MIRGELRETIEACRSYRIRINHRLDTLSSVQDRSIIRQRDKERERASERATERERERERESERERERER